MVNIVLCRYYDWENHVEDAGDIISALNIFSKSSGINEFQFGEILPTFKNPGLGVALAHINPRRF